MARRELTGPQKFVVGGLVALAVVLVTLIIIGRTVEPRPVAAPAPAAITWRAIRSEARTELPDVHVAIIPPKLPADEVDRQARARCAGRQLCKVIGWVDGTKAATAFPMTEREFLAQSYAYDLNRQSGLDRGLFDCRIWKVGASRCMASADD
jgi:hypothetical protein